MVEEWAILDDSNNDDGNGDDTNQNGNDRKMMISGESKNGGPSSHEFAPDARGAAGAPAGYTAGEQDEDDDDDDY